MENKTQGLLNDKIMAGLLLGWISNIPKLIIDTIMYKQGFSEFFCWHVTGGILVSNQWLDNINGLIIGAFMDFFFAGLLGTWLIYFLYYFGENKYLIIKGTLFSILVWVFLCIIVIDQRISMYARLYDPGHAYQSFIVHAIWGIVMSYLAVKYARSTVLSPEKYTKP
jgi:hypothetical protein